VKTLLDTDVIVRHLTQDPPELGQAATRFLSRQTDLVLTDVTAAETVHVLESYYRCSRQTIAVAFWALLAMRNITAENEAILLRCLDLYVMEKMDYSEAYLVAYAENRGIAAVASFDKKLDEYPEIERKDPGFAA